MNDRTELVEIDLSPVNSPRELQSLLMRALDFPDFYGHNWAAFWDAISGLVSMPQRLRFLGWSCLVRRLPDDATRLRGCLDDMTVTFPEWAAEVEYR